MNCILCTPEMDQDQNIVLSIIFSILDLIYRAT